MNKEARGAGCWLGKNDLRQAQTPTCMPYALAVGVGDHVPKEHVLPCVQAPACPVVVVIVVVVMSWSAIRPSWVWIRLVGAPT